MSSETPASTGPSTARIFSIIGAVFAVVALLFLPIILGPIGAVLGFIGNAKGDKPFGLYVGIGAIVATVIGMVLGAIVVGSM